MRNENDRVFKALADASRRLLLDRLYANNGQTLTELREHLDMTRQAVTQHLEVLSLACAPFEYGSNRRWCNINRQLNRSDLGEGPRPRRTEEGCATTS